MAWSEIGVGGGVCGASHDVTDEVFDAECELKSMFRHADPSSGIFANIIRL